MRVAPEVWRARDALAFSNLSRRRAGIARGRSAGPEGGWGSGARSSASRADRPSLEKSGRDGWLEEAFVKTEGRGIESPFGLWRQRRRPDGLGGRALGSSRRSDVGHSCVVLRASSAQNGASWRARWERGVESGRKGRRGPPHKGGGPRSPGKGESRDETGVRQAQPSSEAGKGPGELLDGEGSVGGSRLGGFTGEAARKRRRTKVREEGGAQVGEDRWLALPREPNRAARRPIPRRTSTVRARVRR